MQSKEFVTLVYGVAQDQPQIFRESLPALVKRDCANLSFQWIEPVNEQGKQFTETFYSIIIIASNK